MTEAGPKIQIFGTRGSAVAYALRDFLYRSGVPFQWIELTSDEQARSEVHVTGLGDKRLPVCLFPDGTRLEHPTVAGPAAARGGWPA
jgi:thioredoxin reductase (NADPH)